MIKVFDEDYYATFIAWVMAVLRISNKSPNLEEEKVGDIIKVCDEDNYATFIAWVVAVLRMTNKSPTWEEALVGDHGLQNRHEMDSIELIGIFLYRTWKASLSTHMDMAEFLIVCLDFVIDCFKMEKIWIP